MLEIGDVVKCISNYKNMVIGSYGVVKGIDGESVNIEIASKIGSTGSLTATMNVNDIVKVGKLF